MINGLEGIPGSGKSYEAVVYHVLTSLQKGRKVITNLPLDVKAFAALDPAFESLIELRLLPAVCAGTWDAARVDDKGNGSAFDVPANFVQVENRTSADNGVFGSVWDFYSTWKHPVSGIGPLFVIDECHIAMPVTGTDPQVVEWFKLHRHFNCDVLLATQNFRDMNQPIARLIAMLIKVRSADILGIKGEYIRKVHAGYRGAVISTEQRKYKPEFFGLYKSHSQGNSVAESLATDVTPLSVKFRKFTRGFLGVTMVFCLWAAWSWYNKPVMKVSATDKPVAGLAGAPLGPASAPSASAETSPTGQTMVPLGDDEKLDPYASKSLHLTGLITLGKRTVYTFAVAQGSTRLGQITSDDLAKIGYRWQPLTDCAGTLRWAKTAKSITCDAPAVAEGSNDRPVVVALPAGSVMPVGRSDRPLAKW